MCLYFVHVTYFQLSYTAQISKDISEQRIHSSNVIKLINYRKYKSTLKVDRVYTWRQCSSLWGATFWCEIPLDTYWQIVRKPRACTYWQVSHEIMYNARLLYWSPWKDNLYGRQYTHYTQCMLVCFLNLPKIASILPIAIKLGQSKTFITIDKRLNIYVPEHCDLVADRHLRYTPPSLPPQLNRTRARYIQSY